MDLPNWTPERFKAFEVMEPSSPKKERLELLLSGEKMREVWPALEKNAKKPEDTPGQVNPLDAYLHACFADQWKSSGLADGDLVRQCSVLREAATNLRRYAECIKLLDTEIQGGGSIYFKLMRSASTLGVSSKGLDNLSEPEFLRVLESRLDDLASFHEAHSCAIQELMSNDFSKAGARNGTDARILAVRRTLTRCTSRYFQGPCWRQVAETVNVIARHLGACEDCTEEKLKNARR